jgi:hypothetical protein
VSQDLSFTHLDGPDGGTRGGGPPVVLLESVLLGVLLFSVPPIVVTWLGAIACSAFCVPFFLSFFIY